MDSTCFWELPEVCVLMACRCPRVTDFLWANARGSAQPLPLFKLKKEKKKKLKKKKKRKGMVDMGVEGGEERGGGFDFFDFWNL